MMMGDAPLCQPQSAVGAFYRRQPNPRLIAGAHEFADGNVDTEIQDPDLLWDGSTWHLYYSAPHGTFASPGAGTIIRHATSPDLATWTLQDAPAVGAGSQPTVARDASGQFVMVYSDGGGFSIATSADGSTFTATPGSVLTAATVYPGPQNATIADPELAIVGGTYHLWFSSDQPNAHGIAHATSTNGMQWTVEAAPVQSLLRMTSQPTSGGGQPTVIYDESHCRWEMWLSNDLQSDNTGPIMGATAGYWHATSTNATSWSITYSQMRDVVIDSTQNGEHLGLRAGADVASKTGGRYMLYTGFDNMNVPNGSTLPTASGTTSGVTTLNLATRDAL